MNERIRAAVKGSLGITWDGCHKIYIAKDRAASERLTSHGYDVLCVDDDEAVEQLCDWFDSSCHLRFIQAIKDDEFLDVIPQS